MDVKRLSTMLRASRVWTLCCLIGLAAMTFAPSASGALPVWEDTEKPEPKFTTQGEIIQAKLIPRGRSVNILIDFAVSGGKLASVEGKPFDQAERPEVDKKDFRSALFVVKVAGISSGGEAKVSAASDFFTPSTEYWVFNPGASTPWTGVPVTHSNLKDRVHALELTVKDGGPLDSDGKANGEILLIGGPMDGFWGYALGTLVIRFFGVFLVLSVLMLGLYAASRIFLKIEARIAAREEAKA